VGLAPSLDEIVTSSPRLLGRPENQVCQDSSPPGQRSRHDEESLNEVREARVAANQHPTDGAAIIESAGMSRKNARGPSPAELTVKQSRISGAVILVARAIALWVSAETTFECKTELFGLTRGPRHYFRFRARTRRGLGNWSQVVSFIVA
jgi:hypothetical protein